MPNLGNGGFAAAQYNLGATYHEGQGVPRDLKESLKWYRLAADQGDAQAQQVLPSLYKESLPWLRSEADRGLALAQSGLGVIYAQGLGVPEDIKEAVRLLNGGDWRPTKEMPRRRQA